MKLTQPLVNEERSTFYKVLFGVWGMVAIYGLLHDQYIVRIAPQHFTKYHPAIFPISNPLWLAAAFGLGSSVSPGLGLATLLFFLGRGGSRPKVPLRIIYKGMFGVILLTEAASLLSVLYAWITKSPLYPAILYPEQSIALYMTQSAQLSAYLVAITGSLLLLYRIHRIRSRATPLKP